jgi:MFS family permease
LLKSPTTSTFKSNLPPRSWVTNFFKRKFHLSEGYLGSLFFTTSLISAASVLVAASIAKRIGNVKTMVFTHLPSAIALALIGIPSSFPLAAFFVILRSCTQSMDVAPRSAFLAAIILPGERTAIMGAINVVKTTAQSLGPLITGVLADRGLFWVAFLAAGSLKATYDLGMLAVFAGYQSREEQEETEGAHLAEDATESLAQGEEAIDQR